tara:strand:+ start:340 stop:594 length:255 start_codon:yes stop_codon:yes gene_type:complete
MINKDRAIVDFRTIGGENRGIYYSETKRCLVYLPNHETIDDIYQTITHELVHYCLDVFDVTEEIDEDMEERVIFNLAWAELDLS